MNFEREKQHISASQILQALADAEPIKLSQCTITGVLDINRLFDSAEKFATAGLVFKQCDGRKVVTFSQSIVFDKCIFEENTVFCGPWSAADSVTVEFKENCIFNSSEFKGQARFRNAIFCGTAGFDGCSFDGIVTFKNATFCKDAKFRTVEFAGYFLSGNAVYKSSARFTNTHFVKGANFSEVQFLGQTDFSGVYSSSRAVPACDSIRFARRKLGEDESFWRFAKQSAQEAGYYQLAGEYFYKERCARLWQKLRGSGGYDRLTALRKFLRWVGGIRLLPELVFGRLLFGYGERPTRVLMVSAMIIFACAFFYSQPGSLVFRGGDNTPSFPQGLYFSIITFTTLGYGDFYPAPDGWCRPLAMAQAISGGFLMALFVVCLAKRFSRG